MEVEYRELESREFPQALQVRIRVFVEEQAVPIEEEHDKYDQTAIHFGAFLDNNIVGTGRVVVTGQTGKIGRVAVLPEYRKCGVGYHLVETIIRTCQEMGLEEACLGSQLQAMGFYERLGFIAEGKTFDDAGIPHRMMHRPL